MKKKLLQLRREAIATIPPMDPSLVAIKEVSVLIDLYTHLGLLQFPQPNGSVRV